MLAWVTHVCRDLGHLAHRAWHMLLGRSSTPEEDRRFRLLGLLLAISCIFVTMAMVAPVSYDFIVPKLPESAREFLKPKPDYTQPVRALPPTFPPNTTLPRLREGVASGSIKLSLFSEERDLVRLEDKRVWWESEHDVGDTEDDHLFHHAMEDPMRRLIELVEGRGATLKVQDAYRDKGIHAARSLHKEGRAVDLTAKGLSLEELARLCWAAGFDWVFHESPKRGGAHVHCSVRRPE